MYMDGSWISGWMYVQCTMYIQAELAKKTWIGPLLNLMAALDEEKDSSLTYPKVYIVIGLIAISQATQCGYS